MRLRRIHVRNVKGVAESTVAFGDGVTVVAGPNEAGKSTLADALDLLFDFKDRSKSQPVRAARPVHRDEGPEVEAEIEAGAYRFVYRKRFLKKPETSLVVTAPRAENLTGDEAHERVQAILADSVDVDLWRALRIDQGAALGLPEISESRSLSAALDRAAGAAQDDGDAASLFDRVRAERERYFTATGKEKKELTDADADVADALARRDDLADRLRRLEADVVRSRDLERDIADRTSQLAQDEAAAAVADEERRALDRRVAEVDRIEADAAAAGALGDAAVQERLHRQRLRDRAQGTSAAAEAARADAAEQSPGTDRADAALTEATRLLETAREADSIAAAIVTVREDDLQYRRDELDHQTVGERLTRIVAAESEAEDAGRLLAEARIDATVLEELRAAQRSADAARIRAEIGSPEVEVVAESDVTVRTGDVETPLGGGESVMQAAIDAMVIEAPGVVRVTVRPAGDAEQLRADLVAAESALRTRFERAGVPDIAAAERALAERQAAERIVARRDDIVRQDLRDLTRDALERKHGKLARRVAEYPDGRRSAPGAETIAPDFDAAQDAASAARSARAAAAEALDAARRHHEDARSTAQRLRLAAEGLRSRVGFAEDEAARATAELAAAREQLADEELETRTQGRLDAATALAEQAAAARAEVDAARPADVRLRAVAAASAVEATRALLRQAQDESLEIRTRLAEAGQEGLAEHLDRTESRYVHAERAARSLRRRAAAADRLYTTLSVHRDAARLAYVRPLRDRIVALGTLVFGGGFDVELDDDLRIVSRTLAGRVVQYAGLSGGAQEQLDLLTRLAAAMIVSDGDGVPLILDDALGYSDPARLQALGAVLSQAGRHCQIIVLTCVPDRYRHVAGAKTVHVSSD